MNTAEDTPGLLQEIERLRARVAELERHGDPCPHPDPSAPAPAYTVLCVGDNETRRHVLERALRDRGLRVIHAAAADALDRFQQERPDAVLLDVRLPDLDGFELCRLLKRPTAGHRIPVILMSEYFIDDRSKAKGLECGADAYLTGDIDPDLLIGSVLSAVRARKAEEVLCLAEQQAERRLAEVEAVYDRVPVGLASLDPEFRYIRVNEKLARMNGLPAEAHVGKTVAEVVPEIAPMVEPIFRRALETGEPVLDFELRGPSPTEPGVLLDCLLSFYPLRSSEGRPVGLDVVVVDVTARRRAESAMQEIARRNRDFFEPLPVGVCSCDAEGYITLYNERMVELWGGRPAVRDTRERFCGSARLYRPDGSPLPDAENPVALSIAQGIPKHAQEAVIERPDGSRINVLANIEPMRDAGGAIVGAVGSVIDITPLKQGHAQLETANRRLAFLSESAAGLLAASDPVEFLKGAYDRLRELLDVVISFQYIAGDRELRLAISHGIPEEVRASLNRLEYGQGVCGTVARERRPMVLGRVQEDRGELTAFIRELGITAYACFPLVPRDRLIGTLSFGLRSRDAFAEDEIELLRSVADEVAIALDRKASDQAVRDSEHRQRRQSEFLQSLLNHTPYCVAVMRGRELRHTLANPAYQRLAGPGVQVLGRQYREIFPEAAAAGITAKFCEVLDTGAPWSYRDYHLPVPGRPDALWEGHVVRLPAAEAGEEPSLLSIAWDVTEHSRAEQALRESEARLARTQEFSLVMALHVSLDGTWLKLPPTFVRFLGYDTAGELLGRPVKEFTHPGDFEADWAHTRQLLTGEIKSFEIEKRFIRKDGSITWGYINCSVVPDEQGKPVHFLTYVRDINAQKQAEEALRESELHFRELADSMPQLVWVTLPDGHPLYFNRRWHEQIGGTPPESMVEPWADHVHPEDRGRCLALWSRCLATGEPYQAEIRMRVAAGEYRWFLSRAVAVRDEKGRIKRWIGTSTDIEDSKRDEERARQAQKLESVGLLAGGIAHDFNNLLTGIMGTASLAMDEVPPAAAEKLETVISSAERAAHLTRQLLAYAGKGQFHIRDLNLSTSVRETVDLLRLSVPKNVTMTLDLDDNIPTVAMDPGQFQQVLMNLVINAGEAIAEAGRGRISICTGSHYAASRFVDIIGDEVAPGRYVYLEVTDTGPGMDQATLSRIFDPFFTTKFIGRGLGLAAVSGIVRAQKGAIVVESAPERGSSFRVLFPAGETRAGQPATALDETSLGNILVVDDEAHVRAFLVGALRRAGYRVLAACDGTEALALFDKEQDRLDAVVLDIVMPGMGGNELLPRIRERRPDIKVLLTSGYNESEARRLCGPCSDTAFIQKPYTAQTLVEKIHDMVEARPQ